MVPAGESFVKRNPFRRGFAGAEGAFLHKKGRGICPKPLNVFREIGCAPAELNIAQS